MYAAENGNSITALCSLQKNDCFICGHLVYVSQVLQANKSELLMRSIQGAISFQQQQKKKKKVQVLFP